MGTVEIVYNVISFVVAVAVTVAFTVYARRALDELKRAEDKGSSRQPGGSVEIGELPPQQSRTSLSSAYFDV